MTDKNNPQQDEAEAANEGMKAEGASLQILAQYMKDLSFENPNAPKSLGGSEDSPEVGVSVNVNVQQVGKSEFEVGLHFRVETKRGEEVSFLTELVYCGLFRATNIPEENLRPVLLIEAPRQIFPFARRILSDVTRDGGFPPLMLDPIDFATLYLQNQANEANAGKEAGDKASEDAPKDNSADSKKD